MPAVYDDEDQKQDIEKPEGAHDDLGVHPERREAEVADLEKQFAAPSAPESDDKSLADQEKASSGYGPSALDRMHDRLGNGYINGGGDKNFIEKFATSRAKKIAAAAAAGALGATVAGTVGFFMLLPLKLDSILTNLEQHYSASSQDALSKESSTLFDRYMVQHVFPTLGRPGCHTTVDIGCTVSPINGNSPISSLYKTWRTNRLELQLAQKYDLAFGRNGTGSRSYYVHTQASTIDLGNGASIFGDAGTSQLTHAELVNIINDRLDNATLREKIWFHFKYRSIMQKYGIHRFILSRKFGQPIVGKWSDMKLAVKAYTVKRVVTPISQSWGLIMQCVLDPSQSICNVTSLDPAAEGDTQRATPSEKHIESELAALGLTDVAEKLSELVPKANEIAKKGFMQYIVEQAIEKIAEAFGKTAAGETATKAVPIIGWALTVIEFFQHIATIGPLIKHISYAANIAGAVALYEEYQTVTSERRSGNTNAAAYGSFVASLGSNISGGDKDKAGESQAPLYQSIMDPTHPAKTHNTGYVCQNGSPVPNGALVCQEEILGFGNQVTNEITNLWNSIPVLPALMHILSFFTNITNYISGKIIDSILWFVKHTPGIGDIYNGVMNWITQHVSSIISDLINKVLVTPFSDTMSGARTFDMLAAGADGSANTACQLELGCSQASAQAIRDLRNQHLQNQLALFRSRPLRERLFSTNTQFSLVSRLAIGMPSNFADAFNSGLAAVLANPLGKFGGAFGSLFTFHGAWATDNTPANDPFGIVQYAYPEDKIPKDPEGYWNVHCQPYLVNGVLDEEYWLNNTPGSQTPNGDDFSGSQDLDPDTGQMRTLKPWPCLLLQSSIQAAGGKFDANLLPPDPEGQSGGGSTGGGGAPTGGTGKWVLPIHNWAGPFGSDIWGHWYCGGTCGRHAGVDFGTPIGTQLYAAHDGTIVQVNPPSTSGYGGGYLIKADGENVWYAYQHMSRVDLKQGAHVTAGQPLGLSGCTGSCFGAHLHFSIEKTAHISTYADGATVCQGSIDITTVDCAKQMTSYPPLCVLPGAGINYGPYVQKDEIIGTPFCNQVVGNI